ncbi:hypothetical protein LJB91_02485 [Bacteroidales bacterium OttesenSCG-928-L03]|nr:hypothetical protein [Bacteroidales bacterium OttesenSCG-928-L03]
MDKGIEQSINSRRKALYAHYDLPDDARQKAEELFMRMEQFGRNCRDRADFEEKLAVFTLSHEYNSLFVEFTAYVKTPEGTLTPQQQIARNTASGARSAAFHQGKMAWSAAITRLMPDDLNRCRIRGIYNIPVLGDIASALNNLNIIQRLFGKGNERGKAQKEKEETTDSNNPYKNKCNGKDD